MLPITIDIAQSCFRAGPEIVQAHARDGVLGREAEHLQCSKPDVHAEAVGLCEFLDHGHRDATLVQGPALNRAVLPLQVERMVLG